MIAHGSELRWELLMIQRRNSSRYEVVNLLFTLDFEHLAVRNFSRVHTVINTAP